MMGKWNKIAALFKRGGRTSRVRGVAVALMLSLLLDGSTGSLFAAASSEKAKNGLYALTDNIGAADAANRTLKVADIQSSGSIDSDVTDDTYGSPKQTAALADSGIPDGEVNLHWARPAYNEIEVKWDALQIPDANNPREYIPAPDIDHYTLEWKTGDTWTVLKETKDDLYFLHSGLPEASFVHYRLYAYDKEGRQSRAYTLRASTDPKNTKLIVSLDHAGIEELQLSEDGSTAVFISDAPELPDAVAGRYGLYSYRVADGSLARLGDAAGTDSEKFGSKLVVSGNGRYVAYSREAPDNKYELCRYDQETKTIEVVATQNRRFENIGISRDGGKLVFDTSFAHSPEDTNGVMDVYLFDFSLPKAQRLKRFSVAADGREGSMESKQAAISADGRYAAFVTSSSELLPPGEEDNNYNKLYLYDTVEGTIQFILVERTYMEDGVEVKYPLDVTWPSLSEDGTFIVYRNYVNARGLRVGLLDRSSGQAKEVWNTLGSSRISLEVPKLTSNGRYVYLNFFNYDYYSSQEPYITYGELLFDTTQPNKYRYLGKLMDASIASLSGDGTKGIYAYWNAKDGSYEGDPNVPEGVQLVYVCLDNCQNTPPPEEAITKADIELPQQVNGAVPIGGTIVIRSVAKPNLTLKANIVYERAGQSGTQTAIATLTASRDEARAYRAEWEVPAGAKRIVSVRVEPDGRPAEGKNAGKAPLEVAGALRVKLTTEDAALLQGARMNLWSPSSNRGNSAVFPESLEADTVVKAATDYKLSIVDASGRLLLEKPNIAVSAGELSEVTVAVSPVAQLTVNIVDERGNAIPGVRANIRKPRGELLYSGKSAGDGKVTVQGLYYANEEVEIQVAASYPYQSPASAIVKLQAGSQEREIRLFNLSFGTVEGVTMNNGTPVPGVTVSLLSETGSLIAKGVSDSQGRYSVRAPAGKLQVMAERKELPLYSMKQRLSVTLREAAVERLDVELTNQGFGKIKLDVQVKNVDGSYSPVALTDWRSAIHYGFNVKPLEAAQGFRINAVDETGVPVYGTPGDRFEVCASGKEAGLGSSCVEVELDAARKATAALRLEEAARLSGKVSGLQSGSSVYLLRREGSGWMSLRGISIDANGLFSASLPASGTYRLLFNTWTGIEIYRQEVEVAQGQLLRLPPIQLSGQPLLFAGKSGNGFAQSELRASPGDTVTLRAGYRLNGNETVNDVKLIIQAADGASLLPDSIMVNGAPAVSTVDEGDGKYAVELGSLNPSAHGTLSYRIRLADPGSEQSLQQLAIRYRKSGATESVNETIGAAYIRTAEVTLEAPEASEQHSLTVSGRAPAGKQVLIYADQALIGSAQATPGGLWSAKVVLPAKQGGLIWDKPSNYRLTAKVETGSGYAESRAALVSVDSAAPAISEVSMAQDGGRKAVFHPEDGVARFPFVIVPGQSIFVNVNIANAERVSNPRISIGRQTADLMEISPGKYEAVISTDYNLGSGVFVSYDTIAAPAKTRTEAPTAEQWQAEQATQAADWGRVEDSIADPSTDGPDPEAAYTPTFKVVYPDKDRTEAHVRMSVKYEKLGGSPVPYRGFEPTWDYKTGTLIVKGSISRSAISPQQLRELKALAPRLELLGDPQDPLSTDYLGISLSVAFPKAEKFNTAYGILNSLKSYVSDTMDFMDYSDQLLAFQDYVIQNECYAPNVNYYVKQTENLFDMASTGLVVKNTITGIGLVAGVVLTKLPAWATGSASLYMTAINDSVMSKWNSRLDDLKKEFEADKKWRDDMAAAGAIERCKKKKDKEEDEPQRKVADPVWIWDPSGYAYEALPSNRLEGVKATLLQENSEHPGQWSEWDAEWYGQQNPLITDPLGKYGWDVPEGRWRVLFSKEGYLPAQSADLTVLPPHFDVNVAMVSLQPPVPVAGQAVAGKAIGVTFSKYMVANTVTADGVILENADGSQASGSVEAIDAQADASGQLLARSFRFVPDQPLAEGKIFRLRILAHVQSYAHVGMTAEQAFDFTVLPANTLPREAAADLQASAGQSQLLAEWTKLASGDASLYKLTASPQGVSACEAVTAEVGADRGSVVLEGLCPGTNYELRLTTVDSNGTESAGLTATAATKAQARMQADTTPPGEVKGAAAVWEDDQIVVRWTDPADADLHHIEVAYRAKGAASYGSPQIVAKGAQQVRLLQLDKKTTYEIVLRTFDSRLNGSKGLAFADRTVEPGGGSGGTGGAGGTGGGGTESQQAGAEAEVNSTSGEAALFDGELQLRWPSGAFEGAAMLSVKRSLAVSQGPSGMKPISSIYTLTSDKKAAKGVSLQVKVEESLLKGIDIRKLGLYRQDKLNPDLWIFVGGVVSAAKSTVRADVAEWGAYAVFLREVTFSDIQSHWSRQNIEILASRQLLTGVSPDRFEPDRKLTRAEAVKLLMSLLRASGKWPESQAGGGNGTAFTDVQQGAWYEADILLAAQLGIIQGANGRFRPNDEISREELASIIYRTSIPRAAASEGEGWKAGYRDAGSISAWAAPAMQAAVEAGWLKGRSAATLAPRAALNRGEAAAILFRLLDQMGFISE